MFRRYMVSSWSISLFLLSSAAIANTDTFAIVIGNNAAPGNVASLSDLKYADDDAVRFSNFLHTLDGHVRLLTVPDSNTQKRYGDAAVSGIPPTVKNLEAAIDEMALKIEASKKQGNQTVLFFVFSGHGAHSDSGEPYLSLIDGKLNGLYLYDQLLARLNADFQHLFIDACYAGGVAFSKGIFENKANESDSTHVRLDTNRIADLFGNAHQKKYPGLGVLVSANAETKTHEWSVLQSGIFTHEVLSGLSGAADVNLDGKIEYSELEAFISAANGRVKDERARLSVLASPPYRNQRVPIVKLSELKSRTFLLGNPKTLGHFFIERKNGERYLDANLSGMGRMRIAVPVGETLYLYTDAGETAFGTPGASGAVGASGASDAPVNVADLSFVPMSSQHRGGVSNALSEGLFQGVFGKAYYLGFVESGHRPGVTFVTLDNDLEVPDAILPNNPAMASAHTIRPPVHTPEAVLPFDGYKDTSNGRWQKPVAITSLSLGGASLISSGILAIFAARAKRKFDNTTFYDTSIDWNEKYSRRGTGALVALGVGIAATVTGILLLPKKRRKNVWKNKPAARRLFSSATQWGVGFR